MADFDWTKPIPGGSSGTWGAEINAILDVIQAHPGIKVVADTTELAAYVPLAGQFILQLDTGVLYKCTNVTGPVYEPAIPEIPEEHIERGVCFSINNVDLATTQNVAITAPCALTITGGKIEVGTAPTGAALVCDIHKNGTTLWTTQNNRPTVADAETSAAITVPDVTSIAQGDRLLLMIDQIGSTVAGKDFSLTLYCEVE